MTTQPSTAPASRADSDRTTPLPRIVERASYQAELDKLRIREKAHTHEGDAIAAARRRLPVVEVDPTTSLIGPEGPVTLLDTFEGRRQLIAYYHMWHTGHPAREQCEGCTFFNSQVRELCYLHARDITYVTFCQGPYAETAAYRDFMGWQVPWYSAADSLDTLMAGRGPFMLACYLRRGNQVFETYWTTGRGVEPMGPTLALLDRTVYGRQEPWEDSPQGWPQDPEYQQWRSAGRPIAQWSRLQAGRSDDLTSTAVTSRD